MIRILFVLQSAFSLWMLIDALQRRREAWWYWVILMPFGEVAYFFMVKVHDPEMVRMKEWATGLFARPPDVEQLRYRAERTPSFANHLALGQGLHDHGEHSAAEAAFGAALAIDDRSCAALYGRARSRRSAGNLEGAITDFRRLVALDPDFDDWAGWPELAETLVDAGAQEDALRTLGELVERSPRLQHRIYRAHLLHRLGRADDAKRELQHGLADLGDAPRYVQRTAKPWRRHARKLLEQLERPVRAEG